MGRFIEISIGKKLGEKKILETEVEDHYAIQQQPEVLLSCHCCCLIFETCVGATA